MVIGTCKQLQSMKLSIIFEHLQALLLQVSLPSILMKHTTSFSLDFDQVFFRALNMMAGPNFCSSESQLNRSIEAREVLYSKLCKTKSAKRIKKVLKRMSDSSLSALLVLCQKQKPPSLLPLRIGHSHWTCWHLRFRVDVLLFLQLHL